MPGLAAEIRAGDRRALARALSLLESDESAADDLIEALAAGPQAAATDAQAANAQALRLGFTGPPGAGKSTLIEKVALRYRARGHRVGILAVDPTSAFTGGALLGDRIRMGGLGGDPDVFLRSMATRGHRGGLAAHVIEALDLLAAAGFDRLLVETVGVGQTELEVAGAVHLVIVVLVPEAGDAVQSLKAGLTEIGDIMVVNKADRPGASALAGELREALDLRAKRESAGTRSGAEVPVVLIDARSAQGVDELLAAIDAAGGDALGRVSERRERALRTRLLTLLAEGAERRAGEMLDAAIDEEVKAIAAGRTTPRRASARLLERLLGG